jgi:hypothetical protein
LLSSIVVTDLSQNKPSNKGGSARRQQNSRAQSEAQKRNDGKADAQKAQRTQSHAKGHKDAQGRVPAVDFLGRDRDRVVGRELLVAVRVAHVHRHNLAHESKHNGQAKVQSISPFQHRSVIRGQPKWRQR